MKSECSTGIRRIEHACSIRRRLMLTALLGATALTGSITPALAQDAEPSADNRTIIVTAQRREQALEDVPMSVAVISQDTLSSAGINSIRDLANVTTGFQVANSGIVAQPAIRGITTTNAGSYENNVALFVDGLYQTTPAVLNMDLPNVENIQILKGPQGTLYGRNATGGAILVDTVNPTDVWQGNVEATLGRFSDRRARAYVAGPVANGVGISLAGTIRHTDGYYKRASRNTPGEFTGRFLGLKQESFRAKGQVDVTDTFRITAGYNYLRSSDPRGVFFTPTENVNNSYTVPGRNTRPRGLGEAAGDAFVFDLKQNEGFLNLELDTSIGKLRSITGYTVGETETTYDSFGTYVPDIILDSIVKDKTWQQSIDFSVNAIEKLDLVVGGNYYNIKTSYEPGRANVAYFGPALVTPFTYPNPATTLVPFSAYRRASEQDFSRTKEAWALFADATFHATEALSITLGARYSKETQDVAANVVNYCADPLAATSLGCTIGSVLSNPVTWANSARSSSYSKFTPRASVRYEIAPRTSVYASYSQGFRGGEWNSTVPNFNPALWVDAKPETVNAYEVGVKSGGGRLRYEVAAFYYDYKDIQVSAVRFVGPQTVVTLQNAPSAEIYGAEGNFDYSITDNFTVRGGVTWLHARYGDGFVYLGNGVNPNLVGFNVNSNPLKTFINVAAAQDLSGLQMARAPDFSGFLGFDYNIPKGDGGLRLAANVKYTDSYVVTDPAIWGGEPTAAYNARKALDPNALPNNNALLAGSPFASSANDQRARQGSYATVNASITWTDPKGHNYIRLWGNNLTNATYRLHYRPGTATYIPVGEPITYGVTAGYKF